MGFITEQRKFNTRVPIVDRSGLRVYPEYIVHSRLLTDEHQHEMIHESVYHTVANVVLIIIMVFSSTLNMVWIDDLFLALFGMNLCQLVFIFMCRSEAHDQTD